MGKSRNGEEDMEGSVDGRKRDIKNKGPREGFQVTARMERTLRGKDSVMCNRLSLFVTGIHDPSMSPYSSPGFTKSSAVLYIFMVC